MFESLILKIALAIGRHLITAAAGALISAGYLESAQSNDFIGSGLFLLGLALTAADKIIGHKKLEAARAGAGPAAGLDDTQKGTP